MDCIHHWLIETPGNGPTLHAVCKSCGAKSTFPSGLPEVRVARRDSLVRLFMEAPLGLPGRSRRD